MKRHLHKTCRQTFAAVAISLFGIVQDDASCRAGYFHLQRTVAFYYVKNYLFYIQFLRLRNVTFRNVFVPENAVVINDATTVKYINVRTPAGAKLQFVVDNSTDSRYESGWYFAFSF